MRGRRPSGPATQQEPDDQGEVRAGHRREVGEPAGAEVLHDLRGHLPVVPDHERRHQRAGVRRRPGPPRAAIPARTRGGSAEQVSGTAQHPRRPSGGQDAGEVRPVGRASRPLATRPGPPSSTAAQHSSAITRTGTRVARVCPRPTTSVTVTRVSVKALNAGPQHRVAGHPRGDRDGSPVGGEPRRRHRTRFTATRGPRLPRLHRRPAGRRAGSPPVRRRRRGQQQTPPSDQQHQAGPPGQPERGQPARPGRTREDHRPQVGTATGPERPAAPAAGRRRVVAGIRGSRTVRSWRAWRHRCRRPRAARRRP